MSKVSLITSNGQRLGFRMEDGGHELSFGGTLSGKGLDGWMQMADGKAKCHFLHVLKTPPDVLRKATGTYRISDDKVDEDHL